ncbi:MAG: FAD-dependent oxidoreductase [Thermoleophilia bacterium]|nr:FAD-binding oxidoreductase [Gaiellaceae bacterium]MDW8338061.1 FAD-dependent oxidoreductase [Thermoleophilia bacterium]
MRHTRHGWWLEEAGSVVPTRPLDGDVTADVVIVGGGYLGLWTAWHLRALEPEADVVVLEAELCGHGPSGRNGGFCETLWGDAETLRERAGDAAALAVLRASEDAVRGIGVWCEANGVDAWFREAPMLRVATTQSQLGSWTENVAAAAALGAPEEVVELSAEEVRSRCDSPLFLGGVSYRVNATVHPARLALGLRKRLLEQGVRIHERSEVTRLRPDGTAETRTGRVRAGAAILAVNSATAGFPGFRLALAVASSHIVLTEPVPDVLEQLRWTGGEAIVDSRTLVHYTRTTRDGRIVFGWGGGVMGRGGRLSRRLEVDPDAVARARQSLVRFFPQLRGRAITHAWGGPIDVSPTHLPIFGSRGRVHHGFGFTGNGVGPSYLGGEILARLALDRRDGRTALALVDPPRKRFPPEPARWLGGSLIRRALVAKDDAEDEGRAPSRLAALGSSLPRRLGLRLPR